MKLRFWLNILLLLCLWTANGGEVWAVAPVEVTGKSLPGSVGQSVDAFSVWKKVSDGTLQVVPFQLDERVSPGTVGKRPWAVDRGSSRGDGILDADEALFFYPSDAGSHATAAEFPQATKVWEVSVGAGGKNFVYVVLGERLKAGTSRSYLQYDPGMDRVSTSFYEIGFAKGKPLVQDYLRIKNGSLPYDVLDRFKTRFYLDIKNFFNLKVNEDEVKSQLVGVKVGPIRILRRVIASKSLGPIKVIPRSAIDFVFYPDWVEVSTQINNPVDGPKMLNEKTEGKSGFDFKQLVYGSDIFTNLGGVSLRLDGKNGGLQKKISGEGFRWWSMQGLSGSMVNRIKNDPRLKQLGIHPYLIISNDGKTPAPPESEPGEVFVGFDMPYHLIPKGRFSIQVTQVFPKRFQHGQEENYLNGAKLLDPGPVTPLK